MSAVLLFDTLIFAKRMVEAGMTRKQAEALAEAQKDIFLDSLENGLASKSDIFDVKKNIDALKKDIDMFKKDMDMLKKEFEGKFNLLYWMIGFVLTFCAANLSVLLKIFLS